MARDASGVQCRIDRQLGKGSFGTVYCLSCSESPRKLPSRFALKVMNQEGVRGVQEEQELSIMSRLHHPHIIQLLDSFHLEVAQGRFLMLVMELCQDGDLSTYLDTLRKERRGDMGAEETLVIKWTLQLSDALKYLHGQKIIHRDLKPRNIFMKDKSSLRLGDLGIARQLQYTRQKAASCVGTPIYMSPEIFKGESYSYETDIWSLGCCVFEMMALKSPFDGRSYFYLTDNIINKEVSPPQHYSMALRGLVKTMLSKNPHDRPSAKTLMASLLAMEGKRPHTTPRSRDEVERGRQATCQRFSEEWRSKTAQALFAFRAERAVQQSAQVTAALGRRGVTGDDWGGKDSSGVVSPLRTGGASGVDVNSDSWDHDGEEVAESSDSASLYSTDGLVGDSTLVERTESRASDATLSPHSLSGRGGGGVGHRWGRQTGDRPSQLSRDQGDGGASDDDNGSNATASNGEGCDSSVLGSVIHARRLRIGKSSMLVRARPLPQPRLYRKLVESSSQSQGSGSERAQPTASENDSSVSGALVEGSSGDGSGPGQKMKHREVDMAYANEVLRWARARLLPSAQPQDCGSGSDSGGSVSTESTDGREAETATLEVAEGTKKRGRGGERPASRQTDVARDGQAGIKTDTPVGTAVEEKTLKTTDPTLGEWQEETEMAANAVGQKMEENHRVPVSEGRGKKKKKKNRVFLRGKVGKEYAGRAKDGVVERALDQDASEQAVPQGVQQEKKRMTVDSREERVVVLYPRGQRVTFSKDSADSPDLSIAGLSYS